MNRYSSNIEMFFTCHFINKGHDERNELAKKIVKGERVHKLQSDVFKFLVIS